VAKRKEQLATDRTARLLGLMHFLYQCRHDGLSVDDIASRCGVTRRTTYRDLRALEGELHIPLWQHEGKWGIEPDYFLPPIQFSVPEALTVFLAARLMLRYSYRYDPNVASTFLKLNSIVPSPLREQIEKTLGWMREQSRNEKYLHTLNAVAEAWVSRRQIKITYRPLAANKASERTIDPYFIEPAAPGHSSYVIGYCHYTNSLRTFKIERIETIQLTSEPYVIPDDFDANAYLGSSWGIVVGDKVKTIKLKCDPEIARIMQETTYHPSQVLETQSDGSAIVTFRVTQTWELLAFILQWGEKVEVLEPAKLRREVVSTARAMLDLYRK